MSSPPSVAAAPKRPGLRDALDAFHYRNFAIFWTGALLSNTGSWVQNVTIPYVIFQTTGSYALLGLTGFLAFGPVVLMGPFAGVIADRFHRKSVLLVTQSAQAVVALMLWAVWVTDHHPIGVILALVSMSGIISGLNIASWQSFVSELVPREALLNAVTLNSTQFNASRAFGPAVGGIVLGTLGAAAAFMINAISFLAVIVALLMISVPRIVRAVSARPGIYREFRSTIRYSRARPGIVACFVAVAALGGLGSPMIQLFTAFASRVFLVGDVGYGFLGASLGIGSIIAAPLIAGPGSGMLRSRLVGIATLVYGLSIVAFGAAPVYAMGVLALLFAGAGYLAIASTLNTTIQLQVDEAMRGKVISLYLMLLTAALPIGALVQGLLAQAIGPQITVAGFGVLYLAVSAWLWFISGLMPRMDDDRDTASAVAGAEAAAAVASERLWPYIDE